MWYIVAKTKQDHHYVVAARTDKDEAEKITKLLNEIGAEPFLEYILLSETEWFSDEAEWVVAAVTTQTDIISKAREMALEEHDA